MQRERAEALRTDFNGDGFADLAVNGGNSVYVIYGSDDGLRVKGNQHWELEDLPAAPPDLDESCEASALGATIAAADFNGDHFADLAMMVCGVLVLYGSPQGLSAAGNTFVRMDIGQSGSVAVGEFGRGRYADLAVGDPEKVVANTSDAGAVHVVYGSPDGLTGVGRQEWSQDSPGVRGIAECCDSFGGALAAANFTGGVYDDLAIGAPGNGNDAGSVNVLRGSVEGLTANRDQFWTAAIRGIHGPRRASFFGGTLASGHFAGRVYADLAVGAGDKAPAVHVIYGSADGLTVRGNQRWTENSPGIKGVLGDDWFGASLSAGNLGQDRGGRVFEDLAIGAANNAGGRGAVHVLHGTNSGLTATGSQYWTQDSPGIPGVAEREDQFGYTLAIANFGRHIGDRSYADLIIDTAQETVGENTQGRLHVLYGTTTGVRARGVQVWKADDLVEGGFAFANFGDMLAPTGP